MAANDTAALVVALSAQVSKFQKDMDQATAIASKSVKQIEDKFAQASISVGKLAGGTLLGSLLSNPFSTLIDQVQELGDQFSKTATLAKVLEISISRVQELQFGAALGGVSFAQFQEGSVAFLRNAQEAKRALDEIGTLSSKQINRVENDFARLFKANAVSLTDANGKLKTFDELLVHAADLMHDAKTELDKIKIAEMLGLSREWVRALDKGGDAFRKMAEEANKVGAVVDAELIQKAKEFDHAWDQAIVRLKGAFKGLVGDVKLLFSDLFESIVSPGANIPLKKLQAQLAELRAEKPAEGFWDVLTGSRTKAVIDDEIARVEKMIEKRKEFLDSLRETPAETGPKGDRDTVVPFKLKNLETGFDTEAKTIEKRTRLLEAETATIGLNTFAKEKAKATTELMTAAEQAGLTVTADMSKQIEKVATAYALAALHAEQAKNKFDGINESLRFFGNQVGTILDGLLNKTTTWSAAMTQALRALQSELIKAALTGEGSFAKLLGTTSTTGGVGGLFGSLTGLFRAGGGSVSAGDPFVVGERGPEVFVPSSAGMIVPNEALRRGNGGGAPIVNITNHIDASGADPAAIRRLSQGLLAVNASIESRVVSGLARHRALVG